MVGVAYSREVRGEGVSREDLPEALRGLDIADRFLPEKGFKKSARINALKGNVVVIHRASGVAYFGEEGDIIYENDMLETLAGSRCRLRFLNEDVVTMAAGTRFGVDEYSHDRKKGESTSLLSMVKGKAMFYAMRLFGYKQRRFTLKTPTAVAGVRGTKFGVQVYWVDDKSADGQGVHVAGINNSSGFRLAQADPQGQSFTDIFSEDGHIDINGRTVTPGNMYRGIDGTVTPTPPGFVGTFEAETSVMEGGAGSGGGMTGSQPAEVGDDDTVLGSALTAQTDHAAVQNLADTIMDAISQETGNQAETHESEAGENIADGKTAGWASGLATVLLNGLAGSPISGAGKGPFYVWGPNPIEKSPNIHRIYEVDHEEDPLYILKLEELDETGSQAQVSDFSWGGGQSPYSNTFTYFSGGTYKDSNGEAYLEWGWWQDLDGGSNMGRVGTGSEFFAATARIWHIEGNRTHPDYIAYLEGINAVYSYSGEVKGVLVDTSSTPVSYALTGSCSMDINFGNGVVEDVHINADSVPSKPVILSGTGTLDSDGGFDFILSGTINGNATVPAKTGGGGAAFGAKAQGVGGGWHASDGSVYHAAGEFHANRSE